MRIKKLNNKPDLFGKVEIECYKTRRLGYAYNVVCNGKSIAVYTDYMDAIKKVHNGIYGYPTEYFAY
jgi:hypothetical protein